MRADLCQPSCRPRTPTVWVALAVLAVAALSAAALDRRRLQRHLSWVEKRLTALHYEILDWRLHHEQRCHTSPPYGLPAAGQRPSTDPLLAWLTTQGDAAARGRTHG